MVLCSSSTKREVEKSALSLVEYEHVVYDAHTWFSSFWVSLLGFQMQGNISENETTYEEVT